MAFRSAGSNSLRGGKKKYGPKTRCGSWVELNKEPGRSLPSGFPNSMYKTDAHQQMLEGLQQRPKRYGAGLPPPEDPNIDYNRVINYDKRQRDSDWASITSTEFVHPNADQKKVSVSVAAGIDSDPYSTGPVLNAILPIQARNRQLLSDPGQVFLSSGSSRLWG